MMWDDGNIDSRYGIGGGSTCSGAPRYYAIDEYGGTHPVNEKPAGQNCPKCGTFAEFPKRLCDNCFAKEEVERLKKEAGWAQDAQKKMQQTILDLRNAQASALWMLGRVIDAIENDDEEEGIGQDAWSALQVAKSFLKGTNAPQV